MITDRDQSILWARNLINHNDVVVLDTETTGLGNTAEIVQIAVVDLDGNTLLDTLVQPKYSIPSDATAIHGITNAMVASAPTFLEVHPTLADVLRDKILVIYNADYDSRIINQTSRFYGGLYTVTPKRIDCAMLQYAAFYGDWNEYRGSYRWQKLTGGDHSAHGDCIATVALIKRMAAAKLSTEE